MLSFPPKLDVIDIPTRQNINEAISSTDDDDLNHDIVNPLIIDDYSVYDEQVKC